MASLIRRLRLRQPQQHQHQQQQRPLYTFFRYIMSSSDGNNNNNGEDNKEEILALPAPDGKTTTTLMVNGEAVKLDKLGPVVINSDGTVSRIDNWHELSAIEQKNTLRIIGKRNQIRRQALAEAMNK